MQICVSTVCRPRSFDDRNKDAAQPRKASYSQKRTVDLRAVSQCIADFGGEGAYRSRAQAIAMQAAINQSQTLQPAGGDSPVSFIYFLIGFIH